MPSDVFGTSTTFDKYYTAQQRYSLYVTTYLMATKCPRQRLRGEPNPDSSTVDDRIKFRIPHAPSRGRFRRGTHSAHRDPAKWKHYSLADVDEDGPGGDSNFSIASSFITELRERHASSGVEHEESNSGERRILFRPVRGTKRAKLDSSESVSCTRIPAGIDYEDSASMSISSCPLASGQESSNSGAFRNRQSRRQLRARDTEEETDLQTVSDSAEECFDEEDVIEKSDTDEVDEVDTETNFFM